MSTETVKLSPLACLAIAMSDTDRQVTIEAGAEWPTSPETTFRVQIDSEIMLLVGSSDPSLTYNVAVINGVLQRGLEGTTAAAHHAHADVVHLLTPGGLGELTAPPEDDENPNGQLFFIWKFLKQLNDM